MRLRKKPWITEAIQEYENIVIPARDGGEWQSVFGRNAPLHVELGIGKGRFITEMAANNPGVNYIGIEAQQDVLYYAAQKVADRGLGNVRLLVFDINNILAIFQPGEVWRFFINFCDPWPKNRHAKRRLTHSRFLAMYRNLLRPGGELHFKTDNERLFEFSLNEFAASGLGLRNISLDLHHSSFQGNVMTEYEAKFSALGMKIFRCEAIFPPLSAEKNT